MMLRMDLELRIFSDKEALLMMGNTKKLVSIYKKKLNFYRKPTEILNVMNALVIHFIDMVESYHARHPSPAVSGGILRST